MGGPQRGRGRSGQHSVHNFQLSRYAHDEKRLYVLLGQFKIPTLRVGALLGSNPISAKKALLVLAYLHWFLTSMPYCSVVERALCS